MSFQAGKNFNKKVIRFRSALIKLSRYGIDALKPRLFVGGIDPLGILPSKLTPQQQAEENLYVLPKEVWHAPLVSRRIANVLRKDAIRDGTYGTFDHERLIGWDSMWDIQLAIEKNTPKKNTTTLSADGRYTNNKDIHITSGDRIQRITKRKGRKYQNNREERAQKIEKNMIDMDKRIEEYYEAKHAKKPDKTKFEYKYKQELASANRKR